MRQDIEKSALEFLSFWVLIFSQFISSLIIINDKTFAENLIKNPAIANLCPTVSLNIFYMVNDIQ